MNICEFIGEKDAEGDKTCLCNTRTESTCPYVLGDLDNAFTKDGDFCAWFNADKRNAR